MEKPMAIQRRWRLLAYATMLAGIVLAGVLVYGRFGVQRPGGNPMNDSRFTVDHVRLATDKPFEDVAQAFERQLGRFDPDVYKALAAGGDAEAVILVAHRREHADILDIAGEAQIEVQRVCDDRGRQSALAEV